MDKIVEILHRIRASRWGFPVSLVLLNTVIFAALALILPLTFEENDDVMMLLIANGSYSGTPDSHLVFINVIYGAMLAGLYSLTKAIEWYTLSFAVLHILSMSVLLHAIITIPNRATWERILWFMALYALWARILVALQFTTTAGLVSVAGCVLLLRENNKARWLGVLFIIGASLIRITAAGLVGVLMAPIILYTYRLEWRKYIPLVVMLIMVIGCRLVHIYAYNSDPEWKYYNTYNELRGQLTDNPNAFKLQPEDLPEGVDSTDYKLLLRFIPDPEQMDLATLQRLNAVVAKVSFKDKLLNIHHLDQYAVELAILFALLVLMILTTGNVSKYVFLILYTFFILALMVYVSLDGYLKNRVFLCMMYPILLTDFMLLPNTTGLKRRWGLVIAIVALCGWFGYQTNCDQIRKRHGRYMWEHWQRPLLDKIPNDATVVTMGSGMSLSSASPWHLWPYSFTKYTLGWLTWCPLNQPVGHSYRVLVKDNVYLLADRTFERKSSSVQIVRGQIEKHYGIVTDVACQDSNRVCVIAKYVVLDEPQETN